jgi:hypothetical protein
MMGASMPLHLCCDELQTRVTNKINSLAVLPSCKKCLELLSQNMYDLAMGASHAVHTHSNGATAIHAVVWRHALVTLRWQHPALVSRCHKVLQAKGLLMAVYFGADHFVWAYQIGLITDKMVGERWQKTSLYAWAAGSVCTVGAVAVCKGGERMWLWLWP